MEKGKPRKIKKGGLYQANSRDFSRTYKFSITVSFLCSFNCLRKCTKDFTVGRKKNKYYFFSPIKYGKGRNQKKMFAKLIPVTQKQQYVLFEQMCTSQSLLGKSQSNQFSYFWWVLGWEFWGRKLVHGE